MPFCAPKSRLFNLGYGSYGNAGAGYRENGSRLRPSSICEPPSLATTAAPRAQWPAAPQCTEVSLTPLCLSSLFLLPSTHPRLPINQADTVSLNRGGAAREATPRTTAVCSPAERAACTVSHSIACETPRLHFTPISTSCMSAMPWPVFSMWHEGPQTEVKQMEIQNSTFLIDDMLWESLAQMWPHML